MKCAPDNCPIVTFSDLTPAEQRTQRARKAKDMISRNFTGEQIAKQFGVSRQTIDSDLADLPETSKSKKRTKTTTNPKGAGRPRGRRNGGTRMTKAMLAEAAEKALRDAEAKLTTARMQTLMFDSVCRLLAEMLPRTRLKVKHHMEETYGNDIE